MLWVLVGLGMLWGTILWLNRTRDLKRYGITLEFGALMWRTKRGLKLIDRAAKALLPGWRAFGVLAAALGCGLMVFVFANFIYHALAILQRPEAAIPGARIVIPGLTIPWEGLAGIFSVLVVHEFAHGLVMRAEGIPTKSVGALLFIAIPGAFVEPDEDKLKASRVSKRLKVFGAGSIANIIFAMLCFGLLLLAITPKPGVYVLRVVENSPASQALWPGAHLRELNGFRLEDLGDFHKFMGQVSPGDELRILTERGEVVVKAGATDNRGYLGVVAISALNPTGFLNPRALATAAFLELMGYPIFHPYVYSSALPWVVISTLKWMFLLNLGIGLFNLLPMLPLDGGYIASSLAELKISPKAAKKLGAALSMLVLAVLVINLSPLLW